MTQRVLSVPGDDVRLHQHGYERTMHQDAGFGLRQLKEIANEGDVTGDQRLGHRRSRGRPHGKPARALTVRRVPLVAGVRTTGRDRLVCIPTCAEQGQDVEESEDGQTMPGGLSVPVVHGCDLLSPPG